MRTPRAAGAGLNGAKGVGAGALAGFPGAVATALADAGAPMAELPLTIPPSVSYEDLCG